MVNLEIAYSDKQVTPFGGMVLLKRFIDKTGIKELKSDFGLDSFCLNDFWATEASFRFIMVAYNLMALFKFAALQSKRFVTLRTVTLH